jgi:hypothetical protein
MSHPSLPLHQLLWLPRVILGAALLVMSAVAAGQDPVPVDSAVQAIKKEAVDLNRELAALEEELLFPASTQVAVFVSLDVGAQFELESVQVKIDDKEVANHLYSAGDVAALRRGGVQRLYLGNVRLGEHEVLAVFTGKGPDGRDYRRGASARFSKDSKARFLELRISDRQRSGQPEFEIRDWN